MNLQLLIMMIFVIGGVTAIYALLEKTDKYKRELAQAQERELEIQQAYTKLERNIDYQRQLKESEELFDAMKRETALSSREAEVAALFEKEKASHKIKLVELEKHYKAEIAEERETIDTLLEQNKRWIGWYDEQVASNKSLVKNHEALKKRLHAEYEEKISTMEAAMAVKRKENAMEVVRLRFEVEEYKKQVEAANPVLAKKLKSSINTAVKERMAKWQKTQALNEEPANGDNQ